jgi:HPt (histidine-containing phosphotransfer) domain-containing protein
MPSVVESLDEQFVKSIGGVLDLAVMERLLEDTSVEFLPSLIEVFETESAQRLENIQTNLKQDDMSALSVEAHSLKGTSATFGAESLRSLSERIEKSAKAGDSATVESLVPEIPARLEAVITALNEFSSKLES